MRIGIVVTSFNVGGLERVMITYANKLSEEYDIDIISCHSDGGLKDTVSDKVNIIILDGISLRYSLFKIRSILKENQYDCIMTGGDMLNCVVLLVSRFLRCRPKVIISQHNYYDIEQSSLGKWSKITEYVMRLLYPLADSVFAVSKGIKDYLINTIKIPSQKIEIIYNGIDIELIRKKAQEPVKMDIVKYVIFVGRLSSVKNVQLILRAFDLSKDPDLNLVIVGDGEQRKCLEYLSLSLSKKDRIFFVGEMNNVMPYIKGAQALLISSYSEGFPMVVLESLALNVPVLTTPCNGPLEILEGLPSGWLVSKDFENEIEYSNLIDEVINFKNIDFSNYIKRFSDNKSVKKLERLIN